MLRGQGAGVERGPPLTPWWLLQCRPPGGSLAACRIGDGCESLIRLMVSGTGSPQSSEIAKYGSLSRFLKYDALCS